MQKFILDGSEFIELNKLLKLLNLVETGGEANIRIDNGELKVNGAVEKQRRKKLRPGDVIIFRRDTIQIN